MNPARRTSESIAPTVHRSFKLAMLQSTLGSVLVYSLADQSPVYLLLTVLGIGLAWVFSVRPQRPAPRVVINTILLLVVVAAGFEMLREGVGVSAFSVFVALLLVVKLLDLRGPRDDGQILVLSVVILVAAILTSNSLITGILMILASVLLMRAVVLFQLHTVLLLSASASELIEHRARVDIRSMLLGTGFLCALIGSVIFVVLPRNIGAQAFGQWGAGRSVSGFSDTVELGRPGFISQSSTPVLDLTVTDRNGFNIGGENLPAVYLRGSVLTNYKDGRWTSSSVMSKPLSNRVRLVPPNTTLLPRGNSESSVWDQQYEIRMRSSNDGEVYLFAPWKTVEFRVGDEPMRVGLDFDRGIFLKDGMGGRLSYAVRSKNVEFDEIDYSKFSARDPTIETPIEPEIARLAGDIVEQAGFEPSPQKRPISDDIAAVRLLENHLRSNYTYTLDSQAVPNGEDATKWFLFERKTGHCEYYASSLALMSRSIGVPARVITGYISSDYNTVTGQNVVRESNAHAWIEAEVAPGIWRTFDGTPRADFHAIHEPDPSIWRSLSEMYESIEFLWVRTVVGFDSNSRQNIMGTQMGDFGLSRFGESLMSRLAAGRGRLIARAGIVAAMVFSLSLFVGVVYLKNKSIFNTIIGGILAMVSRLRDRFFSARSDEVDPKRAQLEAIVFRSLEELGIAKPACMPLKSHLRAHRPQIELVAMQTYEALDEASELLYQQLFSADPDPIESDQIVQIRSRLAVGAK